MKTHETFLQLAAAALDFRLSPDERRRLDDHVARCTACRRSVDAMHADAVALGELPFVRLGDRRADDMLATILRPGVIVTRPMRLVAIAALLALLLLGSLVVGAELMRRLEDDHFAVLPSVPVATLAPNASPGPNTSPGPSAPVNTGPSGRLAVVHDTGDADWIEVVSFDGTASTRVAEGRTPAWVSADLIAYVCVDPGRDATAICAADPADPAPAARLLEDADRPVAAPDGRVISVHRGMTDVGETWLIAPDGSGLRQLHAGAFQEWSPDGQWLVGQPASAAFEVAIIRADGTGFRVLAPGYEPVWSPSGARIAYSLLEHEIGSVRVVDVASGEVHVRHSAPAGAELGGPAWVASDGLVFVQAGDLWRLDADTDVPVRLTTGLGLAPSGDRLSVSPDGRWIAFTNGDGADARVGVVSVDGEVRMLELGAGTASQPAWGPSPARQGSALLGRSWANAVVPVAPDRPLGRIEAVTAGGPGFVAVGRGCQTVADTDRCEGIVWTSADGRTWLRAPASDATDIGAFLFPTSGPEIGMFDVAVGTPGIVVIGYAARPRMEATAWFSPDGTSWQRIPLGDAEGSHRVHAVTWSGESFVVVGEDRAAMRDASDIATATARAGVWTSKDGRSWTQVPYSEALNVGGFIDTLEDPAGGGMLDVVSGHDGLVAVGSVCPPATGTCQPAVWTSLDGTSWERAAGLPEVSGLLKGVAARGAGYVAVGAEACGSNLVAIPHGCPALVMASADGRSWVQQPFGQAGDLRSIVAIGDRLFATAPDGPATVWTSEDGERWVPAALAGGPATSGDGANAEWHFAAGSDVAVWLGTPMIEDDPAAWVSVSAP